MRTQLACTITGLRLSNAYSRASVIAFIESKTSLPLQWMIFRFLKPEKLSATLRAAVWSFFGTEMPYPLSCQTKMTGKRSKLAPLTASYTKPSDEADSPCEVITTPLCP